MRKTLLIGIAAVLGAVAVAPTTASAQNAPTLADLLLSDSASDGPDGFDHNWHDYDIVTQAVLLFPDLVAAASDPSAQLTAFLPTDRAFQRLVKEISGQRLHSEADVFAGVAGLGTDTVLAVLQYHIVPASISYEAALGSDDAVLGTLLADASITVDVKGRRWCKVVKLIDADVDDRDPRVVQPDIGGAAANGYAHGIDRVLRPIDLP
jgi:uncharacterized surface protein with fasciclin (FAS1) repeats